MVLQMTCSVAHIARQYKFIICRKAVKVMFLKEIPFCIIMLWFIL